MTPDHLKHFEEEVDVEAQRLCCGSVCSALTGPYADGNCTRFCHSYWNAAEKIVSERIKAAKDEMPDWLNKAGT